MKKLFLALAVASLGALENFAGEIPPAEKILPADTLLMITVPDCQNAGESYRQSPQGQLWQDPAMAAFREKFMERMNTGLVGPLEHEIGGISNYTALLQGQLTFAIVQNGWLGKDKTAPGWVLLLDTRTNSVQLQTNLADLKRKWSDAGKPLKTETIRNVEFAALLVAKGDMPEALRIFSAAEPAPANFGGEETNGVAPPAMGEIYIGQFGSLLIVGESAKSVEKVLLPLTGGSSPVLADVPGFERHAEKLFRAATVFGWANAKAFSEVIASRLTQTALDDPGAQQLTALRTERVIAATGLGALQNLAFSCRMTGDGAAVEVFCSAPESDRTGVLKILAAESKDITPPAFVPADAAKFYRVRVDGQQTWAEIEKILRAVAPEFMTELNLNLIMAGARARETQPGYNLKQEFLAAMGNDFIRYQKSPRSIAPADIASPPAIVIIGTPRPERLLNVLKYFFGGMNRDGEPPAEREFNGRKIYSITLPGQRTANGGSTPARTLAFAATGSYAAISMDAATLEEFLRHASDAAKPLRETSGLADAVQRVAGDGACWLNYENQRETTRTAFELLKQPRTSSAPVAGLQKVLREWSDPTLLPDFDVLAKYFSFAVTAGSSASDGLTLKFFAPRPPLLPPP